jgi:hypothetical protein
MTLPTPWSTHSLNAEQGIAYCFRFRRGYCKPAVRYWASRKPLLYSYCDMTAECRKCAVGKAQQRRLLLDNGYIKHVPECYAVKETTFPLLGSGFGCDGIRGLYGTTQMWRAEWNPWRWCSNSVHMKLVQSEIQTCRSRITESSRGLRMDDSLVEVLPSNG